MAHGTGNLAQLATPTGIDLEVLNRYTFADGVGLGEVVGFAQQMVVDFAAFNWPNHPQVAALIPLITSLSADQDIRFNTGTVTWEDVGEDSTPGTQHIGAAGGMCEVVTKAAALGYTWDALRRVRSDEVVDAFAAARDGAVEVIRKAVLARIFKQGSTNFEGSAFSYGWVGGTGQSFVSPTYDGVTFASDDHYKDNGDAGYADSAAGRRSLFGDMGKAVWEHGHLSVPGAPTFLLHGPATRADVTADAQYLAAEQAFVNYETTQRAAALAIGHGVLKDVGWITAEIGGIPDNYFAGVKSFGAGNSLNPVRLWYPPDLGFGIILMNLDPNPPMNVSPVAKLEMRLQIGVGIQRPDAGTAGQIGGGAADYAEPTIT